MNHLLSQTPAQPSETNSLPLALKSDDKFTLGSIKDLDELRQPILNLPDFATSGWFKKHLSVSRSHLRVFHSKWGRYVEPVTGFAWPLERPDVEEFYDLLPEIAKYPYALRFILGGLFEKMRRWEKRLYQAYFAARREAGLSIELASELEGRHEQVVELAAAGKYEIARAMAILNWALYQGKTPAMARLAVHDPEMSDYLRKFLACDHSLMSEMWTKYARGGNAEDPDTGNVVEATCDDVREEVCSGVDDYSDDEKHPASDGAPEQQNNASTDPGANLDQPLSHLDSYTFASATDEWAARLSEIVQIAKSGQSLAPDRQISTELQSIASRLKDCVDAYEATQPNSIPTEHLIARLLAALAIVKEALTKIDGFDETTLGNVRSIEASAADTPQNVIAEVYTEAEALTVSVESSATEVGIAQQRLNDADATLSHKEYFTVAPELFSQVVLAANETLVRIGLALRMFRLTRSDLGTAVDDRGIVDATEPTREQDIVATVAIVASDTVQTAVIEADDGGEGDPDIEPTGDNLILPSLPTFDKGAEVIAAESDPLLLQIERKADELFICQEFGLAYHLARAGAKVLGDPGVMPYGTDELRLIALGERMTGLSRHEPEGYRKSLNQCATLAQAFGEGSGDRHNARRIALLASVIPTALLQVSDSGSAFAIINSINVTGSCSPFFFIVETLQENRKLGFPLNPTNLRTAGVANAGLSYAGELLEIVKRQIEAVQSAKFRFVLGQKVKHWLVSSEGPVGVLRAGIEGSKSARAAAQFASKYSSRDAIQEMLLKAPDVTVHSQVIDGSARERLIAQISDLTSSCANYAATAQDADEMRGNSGRIEMVRRLTDSLVAGIKKFELDTSTSSGSLLVDAANSYARKVFRQILDLVDGKSTLEADRSASSLALHVPLLWLPGMTWSSAWTPSPNEASRLLDAIMTLQVPRIVGDPGEALGTAIDARRSEDAFIPAKMLLGFAPKFGWEKTRMADELARVDSAEIIRKGQLRSKYQQVSSLVTKVRRMALGGLEGSSQLEESLRAVKIDSEPMTVILDFLPEEIEGTRIVDVNAAANRLATIESRARKLLDDAKETFSLDISRLADEGKISPDERLELERLLAADDLATLSDWIPMFGAEEQRRPGLAGRVVNEALKRFSEISAATPNIELVGASHAIIAGERFGSFDFSALDPERREEIASILRQWFDFKRSMKSNSANLAQIGPRLAELLSHVAFETEVVELNKTYSQERRSIFAIDAKMSLPFDANSLMLPDFGSSTNGGWRIIAAPGTITNAEILSRAEGAEPRGVLVLVFGSLTLERRHQLKIECIKRRRKILVVDELLLLTMLSAAEPRSLTMFEIAQAFTTATPYQDYGRSHVPREMFKGRAREWANIVNPHGSYIVYGGRRLGKTALLRHISRNRPEHGLFAYLDLVDSSSSALWERASGALKEVFAQPVGSADEFDVGVKTYLEGDGRRRILLLLDEADNFVREQAKTEIKHHHVVHLLSLMAETDHRFKFVLAGLHNVSRITRSENSPLAQISNDPVRIGPLVEGDVGDAEILVRGPMSALGYEFANREDVWRILSYTNYYPVLIQVFCQGLLQIIEEQTVRNSKVIKIIDGKMIDSAMVDNQIRKALYESFDKTITHIEQRYELLTYIIAERALIDAGEGVDGDGLTASEVTERAGRYWPEGFPKGSDPSEVEYLLDEMEGFGILRWTASGRWALRSRMLLDLMVTDEEELLGRIYSFNGKQPETQFDPKNSRRKISGGKSAGADGKISPLTDGQEAEVVSRERNVGNVIMVFGTAISNVEHVHTALETSHTALGINKRNVQMEIRGWRDRSDLITQIRSAKKNDILKIIVVTNQTEWTPDWVIEASKQANVAKGIVRPVFIGGPKHALSWSNAHPLGTKTPSRVRIELLRPWARSYLASRLNSIDALRSPLVDKILQLTGGWNDPCQTVFSSVNSGSQVESTATDVISSLKKNDAFGRFGVPVDLLEAFKALSVWCPDGSSTSDVADVLRDVSTGLDAKALLRFGSLVGILALKIDPSDPKREFIEMNVLARDILGSGIGL